MVADLHARLRPDFFRGQPDAAARDEPLDAVLRDRHQALLLAVAEGASEIAGAVQLSVYDTPARPEFRPLRRAFLDRLVVAEAERRRGCGRALMEAATRWAKERGAAQLVLTMWDGNREAERFYAALGFLPLSRTVGKEL
jgi:GNAT superfamily N-acetyltransferase